MKAVARLVTRVDFLTNTTTAYSHLTKTSNQLFLDREFHCGTIVAMEKHLQEGGRMGTSYINKRQVRGISLAAYKRLLPCAIETVAKERFSGDKVVLAPHLNKVYETWPLQQKQAMLKISQMGTRSRGWVARRKKTFAQLRSKFGEVTLDGIFRVSWEGEIWFDKEEAVANKVSLGKFEVEACVFMYSFYTLVIGAPNEVKHKLANMLASKLV